MKATILRGRWNELKGSMKQYIGVLIGNDYLSSTGKKDKKLGRLQIKLGKSKDELLKLFPLFKSADSLIKLHTSVKS